jgi:hypothetical protein
MHCDSCFTHQRVMFLRQVVERSRFRGNANLRVDLRLPARPRRLALCHGVLIKTIAPH